MKRKVHSLIVLVVLLTSQFACKVSNEEDSNVDIDAVFHLEMLEDLQKNGDLVFVVTSVEAQDCEVATVGHNLEKQPARIELSLNEIVSPTDCTSGQSFAETNIDVGAFATNTTTDVLFRLKNTIENAGTLQVTDAFYELTLNSKDGFDRVQDKLWKIPEGFLWGYVAYNDKNVVGNLVDDFRMEMQEIANTISPTLGDYGHFNVNDDITVELRQQPDFQSIETFLFDYSDTNQPLQDLLENYRSGVSSDEVEFRIFRADGSIL